MSATVGSIMDILSECHGDIFEKSKSKYKEMFSNDSLEKVKRDTKKLLHNTRCLMGRIEYANLNKMLAICDLKAGNDFGAVHHLLDSHSVILRQQTSHRYIKTQLRESAFNTPQTYGLNPEHINFARNISMNNDILMHMLTDLPAEWYIVQVTVPYESPANLKYPKIPKNYMHALHITILPTSSTDIQPFSITLPKPELHSLYDVCNEIVGILDTNRSDLETPYANRELYWRMRKRQNERMKTAIEHLEKVWLREWRILFMADFAEDIESITPISQIIDKLISDSHVSGQITNRMKWLLKKIACGACFLTREEIARAVKYVLAEHKKLAENVILSIFGQLVHLSALQHTKRKTLALIVDESMDYVSFESMEILKSHPVTRFPSLDIAYALFKEHESTIVAGCKIVKTKDDMGTCIINPANNLPNMEKRMSLFVKYWLPHWSIMSNVEPSEEFFANALRNHDILMYLGHGSGIQYLSGEHIEKLKVRSVVLLFGCSSMKLLSVGGRHPPYGVAYQYLIAASPCVLGALWEVTDGDIDRFTTDFISTWIPSSAAKQPWSAVDATAWHTRILKFSKSKRISSDAPCESEMLRAVAKSKTVCTQYMTAAAVVNRGLPIKLVNCV